jgi:hypothetical protein
VRRVAWLIILITCGYNIGCSNRKEPAPPLVVDDTFEFHLSVYEGLSRTDYSVSIAANGKGTHEYRVETEPLGSFGRLMQQSFLVDKKTIEGLVEKINELKIMDMENEYVITGVTDAEHWRCMIKSNTSEKTIHCYGTYPAQLTQLKNYVFDSIVRTLCKNVDPVEPIFRTRGWELYFFFVRSFLSRLIRLRVNVQEV